VEDYKSGGETRMKFKPETER